MPVVRKLGHRKTEHQEVKQEKFYRQILYDAQGVKLTQPLVELTFERNNDSLEEEKRLGKEKEKFQELKLKEVDRPILSNAQMSPNAERVKLTKSWAEVARERNNDSLEKEKRLEKEKFQEVKLKEVDRSLYNAQGVINDSLEKFKRFEKVRLQQMKLKEVDRPVLSNAQMAPNAQGVNDTLEKEKRLEKEKFQQIKLKEVDRPVLSNAQGVINDSLEKEKRLEKEKFQQMKLKEVDRPILYQMAPNAQGVNDLLEEFKRLEKMRVQQMMEKRLEKEVKFPQKKLTVEEEEEESISKLKYQCMVNKYEITSTESDSPDSDVQSDGNKKRVHKKKSKKRERIKKPDHLRWIESWHTGTGNEVVVDATARYFVFTDGYFRSGRRGGHGIIVRDHGGKPIVASTVPCTNLISRRYQQLVGVTEGIELAVNYSILNLKLFCNSKHVIGLVRDALRTRYGCSHIPWWDKIHYHKDKMYDMCEDCVKRFAKDDFDFVFPLLKKIDQMERMLTEPLVVFKCQRWQNKVADYLARNVKDGMDVVLWPSKFPIRLKKLICKECFEYPPYGLPIV